jgi:hypothetical protein
VNNRSRSMSPMASMNISIDQNQSLSTPTNKPMQDRNRWNSLEEGKDPGETEKYCSSRLEELELERSTVVNALKEENKSVPISRTPKHLALPPTEVKELKMETK